MNKYAHGEEEVHLEPQPGTVMTEEPEAQPEAGVEKGKKEKRHRSVRHNEEAESEGDKDFVSAEAHALWNKLFVDKGFISERGFGKLISLFFGNNGKERLGFILQAQGSWLRCSGKRILLKYGGDEGGLCVCTRGLGSFWEQEN